ncbi:GtrA family protein [Candidatus Parcubacteria bacterium]|jgi:putative flippase GtrA|nr:GtrA family protein [Candidatus Parcubacteria bacterium]MBT3948951.1 GtrA family protein [Candidatus Parcubacteria bacterium]
MKRFLNRQFIMFVVIGSINTALGYGVYIACLYFLSMHYALALVVEYIFGIINSYIWNRRFTFRSKKQHSETFGKFVMVYVVMFLLNYIFLYIFIDILHWHVAASQIVALMLIVPITFVAHKSWSFSK